MPTLQRSGAADISLFRPWQAASRSAKPLFDSGGFGWISEDLCVVEESRGFVLHTVMVMADDKKLARIGLRSSPICGKAMIVLRLSKLAA